MAQISGTVVGGVPDPRAQPHLLRHDPHADPFPGSGPVNPTGVPLAPSAQNQTSPQLLAYSTNATPQPGVVPAQPVSVPVQAASEYPPAPAPPVPAAVPAALPPLQNVTPAPSPVSPTAPSPTMPPSTIPPTYPGNVTPPASSVPPSPPSPSPTHPGPVQPAAAPSPTLPPAPPAPVLLSADQFVVPRQQVTFEIPFGTEGGHMQIVAFFHRIMVSETLVVLGFDRRCVVAPPMRPPALTEPIHVTIAGAEGQQRLRVVSAGLGFIFEDGQYEFTVLIIDLEGQREERAALESRREERAAQETKLAEPPESVFLGSQP